MTRDIILVTVESLRYDYRDDMPVFDRLSTVEGVTAGHYTRPSLAGLLSGQYRGALETRVPKPTLAGTLRAQGVSTAAVCFSPQTRPAFGFSHGVDHHAFFDAESSSPLRRGQRLRERLAERRIVRAIHRRVVPKASTLAALPSDEEAVSTALQMYHDQPAPRFLWVHLMGSHRPYGRGDKALPDRLDRRGAAAAPGRLSPALDDEEHATVVEHYRRGLQRASDHVSRLLDGVDGDAIAVVAGDHGEELGEAGYYFHGGYRRRTPETITRVPVGVRGIDLRASRVGLIDVAPTLVRAVGGDVPRAWDGHDRREECARGLLTLAPWNDRVSLAWQQDGTTLRFEDARADEVSAVDTSNDVAAQLAALGYKGPG